MNILEGKKTYLVATLIVISGVLSYVTGEMTLEQAILAVLNGLGLGSLRAGIAKS